MIEFSGQHRLSNETFRKSCIKFASVDALKLRVFMSTGAPREDDRIRLVIRYYQSLINYLIITRLFL